LVAAIELKSLLHLPDTHAKPGWHCVLRWHTPPFLTVDSEQPASSATTDSQSQLAVMRLA
jgi:hypothetical protein